MADEPKINFPVLRNGQAQPAVVEKEPPINLPKINLPPKSTKQEVRDYIGDNQDTMARLRGLTFGLSDRAIAALEHGNYEDNLRKIQAERDQYREDNPWKSLLNEMAGGIVSGGPVSRGMEMAGAKLLPSVANYAKGVGIGPLATRLGQIAAEGGLQGELTSQMEQKPGEIGTHLGRGAAMGALSALAGTAAVNTGAMAARGLSRIGQRIALAVGAVKPETFANKRFAQSLADQNLTPDDVEKAVKLLRGDDIQLQGPVRQGETLPDNRPPVRVADVLPKGTMNTVKRAVKSSDRAATDVTEALKNRGAEQGMRLQNDIMSTLSDNVDSTAAQEALKAQRAIAAKPHYDAAYAVGAPDSPVVQQWINDRPVNAKMFRELEQNLKENASQGLGAGKPLTAKMTVDKNGNFSWEKRPTIEDLDTLKKYIDSKRNDLWNPAKMQYNKPRQLGASDAEQLSNQRDDLIKIIDSLTPDGNGGSHYANARKAFADDSELIDAHRAGQAIIRTRPEDVAKQFDKYSGKPELQDQYRSGVAASISDLVDKSDSEGGSAIVRKLYGSKGMQKKLNYVMGNDSTRELFNRNMGAEKVMVDTQKELAPKSGVNDLLSDAEGFSLPLAAVHALSGRFGAAANQLGRFGTGAIGGMAPEVGDQLAKIALMSPEEFALWNAGQKAAQKTIGARTGKLLGGLGQMAVSGIPATMAGQAGRMANQFQTDSQPDPNEDNQ